MNITRLLDVEESLSKAITAGQSISSIPDKPDKTSPAFSNDVNHSAPYGINFSARTGMHYHRYATNRFNCGKKHFTYRPKNGNEHLPYIDEKNPIRNGSRLLCRQCLRDEHLLWECPKLTPAKRVQLVKSVYAVESINSDNDSCVSALAEIQDLDDQQWSEIDTMENPKPCTGEPNYINYVSNESQTIFSNKT